ncbi:MAG: hypothetical protein F6K19_25065 [Cyanothece sp. SIO1E1]|nr:hypothetical protein [Cyanothece sp. SIO1E1]
MTKFFVRDEIYNLIPFLLVASPPTTLGCAPLSVAFFKLHLADARNKANENGADYRAYLSSSYAQAINQEQLRLHLIQSLTPNQLEAAYGDTPPIPIIP